LVAPSVWTEPFGIVVAEALDAGRPVIASGIGGIPEIARDGLEGLLVQPGDVGALTVAMQRVIDDPALRERLGANARLRAARFAPATIVPLLESAYDHVVAERSHARHDGGGDD
jgi:glycogen(starch) synthase